MFENYLKTVWRSIKRNKVYSFINIGGLAIGMAVAMLIGFWVYNETSFNTYFKNYNSIAKNKQNQTFDFPEKRECYYYPDEQNISHKRPVNKYDFKLSFGPPKNELGRGKQKHVL